RKWIGEGDARGRRGAVVLYRQRVSEIAAGGDRIGRSGVGESKVSDYDALWADHRGGGTEADAQGCDERRRIVRDQLGCVNNGCSVILILHCVDERAIGSDCESAAERVRDARDYEGTKKREIVGGAVEIECLDDVL